MLRYSIFLLAWSLILTIGLQSGTTHAFSTNLQRQGATSRVTVRFSTPPESEGGNEMNAFADPLSNNKPPVSASTPERTSFPIDLPSPILLSGAMVLAIIGVGKKKSSYYGEPS